MIKIIELKKGATSIFELYYYDYSNKLIEYQIIDCKVHCLRNEKGFLTYLLYDNDMAPLSDVFTFINVNMGSSSENSREKAIYALRLLYTFTILLKCELEHLSESNIINLKYFLKGYSTTGNTYIFELITHRSHDTINGYLSIYRKFFSFLGYSDSILFKTNAIATKLFNLETSNTNLIHRYSTNEKVYIPVNNTPKYISVEEFRKILEIIRTNYSIREECIVRLMFQCGLRIGEVLGLTLDDVLIQRSNDKYIPLCYIRNRCSDKDYQHAKTCMLPINPKQYRSKDYNICGYGYQTVILTEDLLDLINNYVDEEHGVARNSRNTSYTSKTVADRVRQSESFEDVNYYVFINHLGNPLSIDTWNQTLRKIFREAEIDVDKRVRENNLNHRFRHGFAMFHVKYLHTNTLELKSKMRHRSISSVSCYYNPTIEDEIGLKDDFIKSLYNLIPELKL